MTTAANHISVLIISWLVIRISHLIEVDCGFPELVVGLVKVSHADLSKVTRVVFVDVRSVVMLATSHTTTTWVLSVLAYTTVAGGDMATTMREGLSAFYSCAIMSRFKSLAVVFHRALPKT